MAKEIIQCPHCGAAYRATDQMKEREGKSARCASCKEIFTIKLGEEEKPAPPAVHFEVLAEEDSGSSTEGQTEPSAAIPPDGEKEKKHPEHEPEDPAHAGRNDADTAVTPDGLSEHREILPAEEPEHRDTSAAGRHLAGILAMLILLASQLLWMFRDNENVYPLLEQACETLNCTLPELRDTGKLSVSNRLFSAVENKPGVYRLQLQIANNAAFPQPFPIIEVSLIDSRGIVRARKQLYPDEYLEEYRPEERLAGKTKTEISFMILSPALETTGFELNFL